MSGQGDQPVLARLSVYQPDRPARQFILDECHRYVIGRDQDCTICLDDERLSRRHAKIEFIDQAWWLSDLCSKNGTLINGRPITRFVLGDRQWVEIGGVIACFDFVTAEFLDEDRRRITERWETSVELSRTLKPGDNFDALLAQALQSFVDVADGERGFIVLLEQREGLTLHASLPTGAPMFDGSRSVIKRTVERGTPVVCSDVSFDSSLVDQASIVGGGISALVSMPLRVGDQLLGVIYVDSRELGKHFTELDTEILQALADHTALVIAVSRLREEFADLSDLLPRQLNRGADANDALVKKLQHLLPNVFQPEKVPIAAFVAAGMDS